MRRRIPIDREKFLSRVRNKGGLSEGTTGYGQEVGHTEDMRRRLCDIPKTMSGTIEQIEG